MSRDYEPLCPEHKLGREEYLRTFLARPLRPYRAILWEDIADELSAWIRKVYS